MTTKYQKAKHHARNMQLSQRQMRARMREMEKELSELRAKAGVRAVQVVECKMCGGTGVVDDGEITHSGGVPFMNGPVKCVKDCPACTAPPAQAGQPNGYEATTLGYARWVSPERYAKFSAEVQKWYRPYWLTEPPAQAVSVPAERQCCGCPPGKCSGEAPNSLCHFVQHRQQAVSVPEGWKLVPIEPTEEMEKAADLIDCRARVEFHQHAERGDNFLSELDLLAMTLAAIY